jgi:hypothetical protein
MGRMSRSKKVLSEEEIDEIVTAQAHDDSSWGKPTRVRATQLAEFSLPSELAARAAFFARLHHATNVEDWLKRVVRERVEMEEAAFAELKRELLTK